MKKRILSIILSIVMCISLLPVNVLAVTNSDIIYIDGDQGNDANDGVTAQAPVKTLGKAIELAGENGTIIVVTTAYITNNTIGSGSITLNDLTIERWSGNDKKDLLLIQGSSDTNTMKVTLKNITIDGKDVLTTDTFLSLIKVNDYGELVIDEGTKLTNQNGIAVYINQSTAKATMIGGEISGNATVEGSPACPGVYVSKGSFEMSGGSISDNTNTYFFGGGVYVDYGTFVMSGGTITKNYAHSGGGGVAVNEGAFTLSGGKITDNVADCNNIEGHGSETTYGGGVYAYDLNGSNTGELDILISDGEISGNTANFGKAMSVMSRSLKTSVSMCGSPKIVEEVDIGPSGANPVKVVDTFTPVGKVTLNLWGAGEDSTIAVYNEGVAVNANAFVCYTKSMSTTFSGQSVILKDGYAVAVENGDGDGYYDENAIVTIKADTPESGKKFAGWTSEDGITFADSSNAETTFTMPGKAVTVTATYDDLLPGKVTVNGIDLVNGDADHTIACGNGTAVYDPATQTLTLTDATIGNSNGDGIVVEDIDITIHGIDTDADGSNQISGSTNAIKGEGNITITGKLGDITGGSFGGIYSTGGNILIPEGTVLGDVFSDWYTIQTDAGTITIDGTVGNISGVIGITSEYDQDTVINGKVGNIIGDDYGIFAYKNLIIGETAEIGNISGTIGGLVALTDITVKGKLDDINGITYGIYAIGGAVTIDGQVNKFSGQCPIRAKGDIGIGGDVGAVAGNGGANGNASSYGVRSDYGKIKISSAIGSVSASSDGTNVMVMALMAKNGIEIAENIAIKLPKNNIIGLYNDSYYTVYNTAGTENVDDDAVAATVKFGLIYKATFNSVGGSEVESQLVIDGEAVAKPADPTRSGYTFGGWYTDETYTAVYDFSARVTENITLYAKWTATTYNITLIENGGTIRGGNVTKYTYGDGATLPNDVTRSGFYFGGWYDNEECEGTPITEISTIDIGDKTFYAKWTYIPSDPTYPPVVNDSDNGDVTVTPKDPVKGDTVIITPDPDMGYEVDEVIVTDKDGNPVTVVNNDNGTYSFVQPNGNATIAVIFKEINTVCPRDRSCPMYGYTDLDRAAWYHDSVHFCIANGLMQGIGNDQFSPSGTTTRATIVTILWRLEGRPDVNYLMDFDDVTADKWYTEAIRWAASVNIVEGYGNGKFGTNDALTREQIVTIMFRYTKYKGYDVSVGENTGALSYDDTADVAEWAIPAMKWACGEGLIQGIADSGKMTLVPQGNATRAQTAAILQRFCENIVNEK